MKKLPYPNELHHLIQFLDGGPSTPDIVELVLLLPIRFIIHMTPWLNHIQMEAQTFKPALSHWDFSFGVPFTADTPTANSYDEILK